MKYASIILVLMGFCVAAMATGMGRGTMMKINAGGPAVDGFLADQPYIRGSWGYLGGSILSGNPVAPHFGYPEAMRTCRYSTTTFEYRFDVPNGRYAIELFFAEPIMSKPGDRRFNVSINGESKLVDYDLFADAGAKDTGVVKTWKGIAVTDGQLTLRFGTFGSGSALVNAISVQQDTGAASPRRTKLHTDQRVQSLDGEWQIAIDPRDIGKANAWYTAAGFPLYDSRSALVPGNIYESWPNQNGISWYHRTFTPVMPLSRTMRYYLRIGACQYSCEIWLNGISVGTHEGADAPFELDVTDHLQQDQNAIAIRVFCPKGPIPSPGGNGEYPEAWGVGGLTQHVTLVAQPFVRITDVFARPDCATGHVPLQVTMENNAGTPADIELIAEIGERTSKKHLDTVKVKVTVPPGVSEHQLLCAIKHPHLWNLDDPFLYTVNVTAKWHRQHDEFLIPRMGFREFKIDTHGYFSLNGRRLILKGVHQNVYDPISTEGTPRMMDRLNLDFPELKRAGFNMFREIIHSALPEQLEQADEQGFLIYSEHQGSWLMRNAGKFGIDLPALIKRDRNHPSLVIWGLLNETNNNAVYQTAKAYLPMLREVDDTRLVLLNSGRWDNELTLGSGSNPGSTAWDAYLGGEDPVTPTKTGDIPDQGPWSAYRNGAGDIHIYQTYPTSWKFITEMATLARDTRPVFLSEAGIGSAFNPVGEKRMMQEAGAPNHAPLYTQYINPILRQFETAWAKYALFEVYPSIEDMIIDSQKSSAQERALLFDIVRSNPKINGYSVTSLTDIGAGEGFMDNFRHYKAGHFPVFQAGWAKLRWCLFINPMNAYAEKPIRVRVALANEDVLAAGAYAATLRIVGETGEVWKQQVTVTIPGGANPPLAFPVCDEDINLPNLREGHYRLSATFDTIPNAGADQLSFTITRSSNHPSLAGITVTVLGVSQEVRDFLTSRGATLRDYIEGQAFDQEIILVGETVPGTAGSWRALYQRIARGAHAVFLSPKVFNLEKTANKWLAVKNKGRQETRVENVYHGDGVVKSHPIFNGLPAKLMTPGIYGNLLFSPIIFRDVTVPDETVVVWIAAADYAFREGLAIGTYNHHAGKFTINAFNITGNLGLPATDRMLLNLVIYGKQDAAQLQALPTEYAAELDALGITQ